MAKFMDMVRAKWKEGKFVCVGLDVVWDKLPTHIQEKHSTERELGIREFNRKIVEATKDLVCAYKPNAAFYEREGPAGRDALWNTLYDIHLIAPDVSKIYDAKRADIGNTNDGYAVDAFDNFHADAITVNPYFGQEALEPFLSRADKGIIVLCRTSNPGAGEFQDWDITGDVVPNGYMPLYQYVAYRVDREWNKRGNCMLVVGATGPQELREVRKLVQTIPFLIPGVGKQGGTATDAVMHGCDYKGEGIIINSSRDVIFASSGEDFAEAARAKMLEMNAEIAEARERFMSKK